MNIGWIKLHRQFKDWEWYNKSEMVHLFIHCLIKANFKDSSFQGIECKKGSFITSLKHLSDETNISIQTIRTCLKKLQLTKEIDIKSTNKLTQITICNYDSYQQESDETNKQLTNNQQTTNKQLTTIEEYKENKEEKKVYIHPLQKFISDNLPTVSKLEIQLTNEQCEKLIGEFNKDSIKDILESMENSKQLTKKYKSVNLTIRSWIKTRQQNNPMFGKIETYLPNQSKGISYFDQTK